MKPPIRVAVTGAAGQFAYSTVFRAASGEMFGPDQPVILHLIDLPNFVGDCRGVGLELEDSAFPTLAGVVATDSLATGFRDIDYALLIGSKPRGPGQERGDLLNENGKIFIATGQAINDNAKRTAKILVVGNPCNTNCLILSHYAKDIPRKNFTALSRLDHDRALWQLSQKCGVTTNQISNFAIWGNHSPTMFPDHTHALANGKKVTDLVSQEWVDKEFIPTVQTRGAAIIAARKKSSAGSGGNAVTNHVKDWHFGTNGKWVSKCILSDGNPYGVPNGLIFSFPVTVDAKGEYQIVKGLKVSAEAQKRINITTDELLQERKFVEQLLK